ncbi:MAG: hypothetical protein PHW52_03800 [Candidatus Pacebacteria bacterium]|nr:hypothetical protein [Candidatus Paceibacterota bacterium]
MEYEKKTKNIVIGFSHGVLYKIHDINTEENMKLFQDCGCNAIEVNYHHDRENEFLELNSIIPYIRDFDYVSLHAPCDIRYGNNEETRILLKRVNDYCLKINAQLVVVHPDLVDDWEIFDEFKINWAIENMDDRKEHFKDLAELKAFFTSHPTWKLVLDLGHCNANDKTMGLAENLIHNFVDRIKEIHLSGYETFHDPLYRTKQSEIIKLCNKLDVPIIIESTFGINDGVDGLEREFGYIMENLD